MGRSDDHSSKPTRTELAALCETITHMFPSAYFERSPWLAQVRRGEWAAIPKTLRWVDSVGLGYLIDGWRLWEMLGRGSFEDATQFAHQARHNARTNGQWEGNAVDLWVVLFAQHRFAQYGDYPTNGALPLLDLLCRTLRERLMELPPEVTGLLQSRP